MKDEDKRKGKTMNDLIDYIKKAKNNSDAEVEILADSKLVAEMNSMLFKRLEKGRNEGKHGWWDDKVCTIDFLESLAKKSFAKGELMDAVAYIAMVLVRRK